MSTQSRHTNEPAQGTALVTGASSGIGARTAELLAGRGHRVWGAARRTEAVARLDGVTPVALDLTDAASVAAAVDRVTTDGPVGILVNCAGYGEFGTIEETSLEDARKQLDVNVFGAMALTQQLLPSMRRAGGGRIVNVSSLAGEFSAPLGGWYHASKFALEALSDALRGEVAQFGIDVAVVQPGYVATAWHDDAMANLGATSGGGPYAPMVDAMCSYFGSDAVARQTITVDDAAGCVLRAATDARPRTRYRLGPGSTISVAMATLLPDRVFDALTRRQFGYPAGRATTPESGARSA